MGGSFCRIPAPILPYRHVLEESSPNSIDFLESPGFSFMLSLDSVSWFLVLQQISRGPASLNLSGTCSLFFPLLNHLFYGKPGNGATQAGCRGVQASRNGGVWPVTSEDGGLTVQLAFPLSHVDTGELG